jgi:hypothetical protein
VSAALVVDRFLAVRADAVAQGNAGANKAPLPCHRHAIEALLLGISRVACGNSGHSEPLAAIGAVEIAWSLSGNVDNLHGLDTSGLVGDN